MPTSSVTVTTIPLTAAQLQQVKAAQQNVNNAKTQRQTVMKTFIGANQSFIKIVKSIAGADQVGPCVNGVRTFTRSTVVGSNIVTKSGTEACTAEDSSVRQRKGKSS